MSEHDSHGEAIRKGGVIGRAIYALLFALALGVLAGALIG